MDIDNMDIDNMDVDGNMDIPEMPDIFGLNLNDD